MAFFTDGMLTSGSPLASIPDGSLLNTVVFAMGFGTGADVDYATLDAIVAKGESLAGTQVFHGDNAGAIDKFYSQALSAALGFTPVMDPVTELHAGEHEHLEFTATSADDVFFVTSQGMDLRRHLVLSVDRGGWRSGLDRRFVAGSRARRWFWTRRAPAGGDRATAERAAIALPATR